MATRQRQRGFTLIEMMVVVAIIAILSGLMISASSRPVGASARNVSEQLVSTLNFAKLRAQSTRRVHKVTFDQTHVWVMVASNTGLVPPVATTYAVLQTTTLPVGVKVFQIDNAANASPGNAVTDTPGLNYDLFIRPDSQSTSSTIYVGDGVHEWRVIVYPVTGGVYSREAW